MYNGLTNIFVFRDFVLRSKLKNDKKITPKIMQFLRLDLNIGSNIMY